MLKKILLLTDVSVNNCAWNYVITLNEKILYIVTQVTIEQLVSDNGTCFTSAEFSSSSRETTSRISHHLLTIHPLTALQKEPCNS